ncbi:MAG: OmpA family protein [Phycisphaerae bacterium]
MKRFVWNGLKVSSVMLMATIFSGCVSLGKYDELKFAERNCNAAREQLQADLAGAKNTIYTLDQENRRLKELLANREDMIKNLKDLLAKAGISFEQMKDIYGKLANRPVPTGQMLASPLPPALDTALKDFASKYPNLVEYDAARGVLKFKSDVLFDLGSDQVKPEVVQPLEEFAKIMEIPDAANFDAVVVGHTDNIPIRRAATLAQHKTNWHLSVHRSISVMNVLKDGGITPERMGVMGYGEYRPVAPNNGLRGNPKNRRVEIYIVPKQGIGDRSLKPTVGGATQAPAPAKEAPAASDADEENPSVEK